MFTFRKCTNCGKENKGESRRFWWGLNNYFGISGYFCPECYDKVSHSPIGKPENLVEYQAILDKQSCL